MYDNDSNGLEENDAWRALWANTHRPGALSALVGKRVYPGASAGTERTPKRSGFPGYEGELNLAWFGSCTPEPTSFRS